MPNSGGSIEGVVRVVQCTLGSCKIGGCKAVWRVKAGLQVSRSVLTLTESLSISLTLIPTASLTPIPRVSLALTLTGVKH